MSIAPQAGGTIGFPGDSPTNEAPESTENRGGSPAPGTIPGTGLTLSGQPFKRAEGVVRIQMACGSWFSIEERDLELVGALRWHGKRKSGHDYIYVQHSTRTSDGRKTSISLHRFLLGVVDPSVYVDHWNGCTLDNRRENLRPTDARGNSTNVTKSKLRKRGGWKGVSWHPGAGKWQVSICAGPVKPNGKRKQLYLGLVDDPVEGAKRYDEAARKYFGEFASTNFPANDETRKASGEGSQ